MNEPHQLLQDHVIRVLANIKYHSIVDDEDDEEPLLVRIAEMERSIKKQNSVMMVIMWMGMDALDSVP